MRKMVGLTLALVLSAGCETETDFGSCKGLVSMAERDPALVYEASTRNVVLAAIFSPSLIWPVMTGALWLWCPTGRAAPQPAPKGSAAPLPGEPHGALPGAPEGSAAPAPSGPQGAHRRAPERSPVALRIGPHGALRHG